MKNNFISMQDENDVEALKQYDFEHHHHVNVTRF